MRSYIVERERGCSCILPSKELFDKYFLALSSVFEERMCQQLFGRVSLFWFLFEAAVDKTTEFRWPSLWIYFGRLIL